MADITYFRFWAQKVIPLVYDDSLSYYEVLCKMRDKLNEVINVANAGGWSQEEIEAFVKSEVDTYLAGLDLPTAAEIQQLQEDVGGLSEDVAELADEKMNILPQDQTDGAIVVVDGRGVASGEVTLGEIQQDISDAATLAQTAKDTADTAADNASSALTATGTLDANKADKVSGYTTTGKIVTTGANSKTITQGDKGIDDLVAKRKVTDNAKTVYANLNGVDEYINVGTGATGGYVAQRKSNGNLSTGTPQSADECVPKSYADAIAKIPVIDFNGALLELATSVSLYNAFATFGCAMVRNADARDPQANALTVLPQLVIANSFSAGKYYFIVLLDNADNVYYSAQYYVSSNGTISYY